MSEEKNDCGIAAFKVEFVEKPTVGDDGSEIPGKVSYAATIAKGGVPKGILDYGDFWDVEPDSSLFIYGEDGKEIFDEPSRLYDYIGSEAGYLVAKAIESLKLPGQWVSENVSSNDYLCNGGTVVVTALSDIPRISADLTIRNSDIGRKAQAVIKLYGEPLLPSNTMVEENGIFDETVGEAMLDACEKALKKRFAGVDGLKILGFVGNPLEFESVRFRVTASNKESLVRAFKEAGVRNVNKISVMRTEGLKDAVTSVSADIKISSDL